MRESNNSEYYIIITKDTRCFHKGFKQQWKLNNNGKRTHDVFITESNNCWILHNNNKTTHDVFIRESNDSEN